MFGECYFLVVENDPFAILLQVCNIVAAASIFANVADQPYKIVFAITIFKRRGWFCCRVPSTSRCVFKSRNGSVEIVLVNKLAKEI